MRGVRGAISTTWTAAARRPLPLLVAVLALFSPGCMGGGKWDGAAGPPPASERVAAVAVAPGSDRVRRNAGLPELPLRRKIRMCCAFGTDLRVALAGVPLPFVHVGQVLDPDDLGPHRYDGTMAAIDDEREGAFPFGEHNGLVYTCRGGFIDTAHVRETVDWTAFLVTRIDRLLETGGVIELTNEGAARRIVLTPPPTAWIERQGRRRVVLATAQWLSYQISLWHEIAQWYGWSIVGLFPEGVSAFSPEELYSNAVGVRLLDDIDLDVVLASEKIYDRRIDRRTRQSLEELGAGPVA